VYFETTSEYASIGKIHAKLQKKNSPAGSENMMSSAIASIADKYWTLLANE
jgi:hypothetical protein